MEETAITNNHKVNNRREIAFYATTRNSKYRRRIDKRCFFPSHPVWMGMNWAISPFIIVKFVYGDGNIESNQLRASHWIRFTTQMATFEEIPSAAFVVSTTIGLKSLFTSFKPINENASNWNSVGKCTNDKFVAFHIVGSDSFTEPLFKFFTFA